MNQNKFKALVVLSGGQDSTTCMFWAIAKGYDVYTITFDYGQNHIVELNAADVVAEMAGIPESKRIRVNLGQEILAGSSPLINPNEPLEQYVDHHSLPGGLEKTFVPMRNQLFLTVAANRAFVIGCDILVTGVCQEDSGGYPDCRRTFIDSFEEATNYGTFTPETNHQPLKILTPLMNMTKAQSVWLALGLPGCWDALAYTHTAYDGNYPPTGHDHASLLRAKGFEESGMPDPLVIRACKEGLMPIPSSPNYNDFRLQVTRHNIPVRTTIGPIKLLD